MSQMQEINAFLMRYFEILNAGEPSETEAIFLPECRLVRAAGNGTYATMTMQEYRTAIAGRQSPASAGHPVLGRILTLDISGPQTAFAKVACAVQPKHYIDYLTLVRVEDGWKIAAKVYRDAIERDLEA